MVVNHSFSSFPIAKNMNAVMNKNSNTIVIIDEFSYVGSTRSVGKVAALDTAVFDARREDYHNANSYGKSKWDKIGTRAGHKAKKFAGSISPKSNDVYINLGDFYNSLDHRGHLFRNYRPMVLAVDKYLRGERESFNHEILVRITQKNMNAHVLYLGSRTIANCISRYLTSRVARADSDVRVIDGVVDYALYVKTLLIYSDRAHLVDVDEVFNILTGMSNFSSMIKIFNLHIFDDDKVFEYVISHYFFTNNNIFDPLSWHSKGSGFSIQYIIDWAKGTGYGVDILENLVIKNYDSYFAAYWIGDDGIDEVNKINLKYYAITHGEVNTIINRINRYSHHFNRNILYSSSDFYADLPDDVLLGVVL